MTRALLRRASPTDLLVVAFRTYRGRAFPFAYLATTALIVAHMTRISGWAITLFWLAAAALVNGLVILMVRKGFSTARPILGPSMLLGAGSLIAGQTASAVHVHLLLLFNPAVSTLRESSLLDARAWLLVFLVVLALNYAATRVFERRAAAVATVALAVIACCIGIATWTGFAMTTARPIVEAFDFAMSENVELFRNSGMLLLGILLGSLVVLDVTTRLAPAQVDRPAWSGDADDVSASTYVVTSRQYSLLLIGLIVVVSTIAISYAAPVKDLRRVRDAHGKEILYRAMQTLASEVEVVYDLGSKTISVASSDAVVEKLEGTARGLDVLDAVARGAVKTEPGEYGIIVQRAGRIVDRLKPVGIKVDDLPLEGHSADVWLGSSSDGLYVIVRVSEPHSSDWQYDYWIRTKPNPLNLAGLLGFESVSSRQLLAAMIQQWDGVSWTEYWQIQAMSVSLPNANSDPNQLGHDVHEQLRSKLRELKAKVPVIDVSLSLNEAIPVAIILFLCLLIMVRNKALVAVARGEVAGEHWLILDAQTPAEKLVAGGWLLLLLTSSWVMGAVARLWFAAQIILDVQQSAQFQVLAGLFWFAVSLTGYWLALTLVSAILVLRIRRFANERNG